jgi:biopolymer transport protein ExbD
VRTPTNDYKEFKKKKKKKKRSKQESMLSVRTNENLFVNNSWNSKHVHQESESKMFNSKKKKKKKEKPGETFCLKESFLS